MARAFSDRPGGQRALIIGGGIVLGLMVIGAMVGPTPSPPRSATASEIEFISMPVPDSYAMIFPEGANAATLEEAARDKCRGAQICQVFGWTNKADAAPRLPMLDRELATLAFSYTLNRNGSYEEALFSCERFPNMPKERCLA